MSSTKIFLHSITLPESITNVDRSAFDSSNLQELYIGDAINRIGMSAFSFVPIVHLNASVSKINDMAFEEADGLQQIYIPNTVKEMEANAFAFCGNLKSVNIDDLANWCEIKFGNEFANPTSKSGRLFINGNAPSCLEVPEGVKSINEYAFYGCSHINELSLSDSVEKIGDYAFYGCTRLSTLRFGKGLRYIGVQAIHGNAVSTIYTNDINSFCQIDAEQYIFHQLFTTELICDGKLVTKINLPEGIEHIGKNIFENYAKLSSISMPNTVSSIGVDAFYRCFGLIKVHLSDSIKEIPTSCFGGAENLASLNFPAELEIIGDNAFSGIGLTTSKMILPSTVKSIGEYAFHYCKADSIILSDNIQELGTGTFGECPNLKYIYLGKSMERISNAFRGCNSLTSIELPATMEYCMMLDCPNLK